MIHLDAGTFACGAITSVDSVRLDGRLEGSVCCPRLEIGPGGYLLGDAQVEELIVEGQLVGEVHARLVELRETALVEGDVHHEKLIRHQDAVLVGSTTRHSDTPPPATLAELRERARADAEEIDAIARASLVRPAVGMERPSRSARDHRSFS